MINYIYNKGTFTMEITSKKENESLIISIDGRIDTNTAPTFNDETLKLINGEKRVVLDFTDVEYISSAGLRVVLSLHKSMAATAGELIIAHARDEVMEVFDMTGFSSFLIFED